MVRIFSDPFSRATRSGCFLPFRAFAFLTGAGGAARFLPADAAAFFAARTRGWYGWYFAHSLNGTLTLFTTRVGGGQPRKSMVVLARGVRLVAVMVMVRTKLWWS